MKKTSKSKLSISLIGYPTFGNAIPLRNKLPTQKAQALLIYLIVERIVRHEKIIAKEALIDLLWPGMPSGSALQNLRQAIYQIRKNLTENKETIGNWLETDRKSVRLSEYFPIDTDIDWYSYAIQLEHFKEMEASELIKLYYKPFLEDFNIPGTPQFDNWIEQIRAELKRCYLKILEQTSINYLDTKKEEKALILLEKLTETDPYAESYQFQLIKLLNERGGRTKAIQAYESYIGLLKEELDLKPSPKMLALYRSIQDNKKPVDIPINGKGNSKQKISGLAILALLILTGLIYFLYSNKQDSEPNDFKRMAILPMDNYTSKDYLADGITDDVLTGLTKLESVKMISRQSTVSYKDSPKTPTMIGKELEADYLIKGSIAQVDHQYKANIQLLDALNGNVIWAKSFQQDTSQVASLQSQITQGIANQLGTKSSRTQRDGYTNIPTQNGKAYNAYLKGRYLFYQANPTALHEAITFFQTALDLDPDFNLAHAWLAWTYCSLAGSWGDETAIDMYPKVQKELSYIEGDPELESMYFKVLGWMNFWLLDRAKAEAYLRQAVKINPNEEFGLSALAMVLSLRKAFEESQQIAEQALDLNPHFFWNHFVLGQAFYYDEQFEKALPAIENGLALFPYHQASIGIKARLLSISKREKEAVDYLENILTTFEYFPANTYADLGLVHASFQNEKKAIEIAKELESRHAKGEKYTAYYAAKIFSILGDHKKAIDLLEAAYQNRDNELNWMEVELEFRPLYDEARFRALLQKLKK